MNRYCDPGDFPRVILLDTCSFCNLRCTHCSYRNMTRQKGMMSVSLAYNLIDEISATAPDTRVWMVYFGEALINKNIFKMIKYAKYRGLADVVLNSNGMLLSSELIDSGLDAIYIGIDAFTRSTYNKLRVGGDLDRVDNAVRQLNEASLKVGHPKVYVQFVETELNTQEKQGFIDYWTKLGIRVKVRPKISWAGQVSSYGVQDIKRYPCHWAMQTMSILHDGRVSLCAVDLDGKFIAGDVSRGGIKKTWANMKWIRDAHLNGQWDKLPEFCQKCTDWQMAKSEVF